MTGFNKDKENRDRVINGLILIGLLLMLGIMLGCQKSKMQGQGECSVVGTGYDNTLGDEGFRVYCPGNKPVYIPVIPGPKGDTGEAGTDGTDGVNGTDGVDGSNGADGQDGVDGVDGVDGQNGTDGIDGVDGVDGIDGQDGVDGQDGATGAQGPVGPAGPMGPTGPAALQEVVNPCGEQGLYEEVLLRFSTGQLMALYYDGANQRSFLTELSPGSYVTTDGFSCLFTVHGDLSVTW